MSSLRRAFVALLTLLPVVGGCRPPDRGTRQVVAVVREAPSLRVGDRVEYRGLAVGSVTSLEIPDGRVHLTLTLTRPEIPLRATDRVRVVADGVFGASYVEIVAPSFDAPLLVRRRGVPDTLASAPYVPPDTALARLAKEALDSLRPPGELRHR
jgi:ABC-type transporter Mla subunit MlaD